MTREFKTQISGLYYSYINPELPVIDKMPDDGIEVDYQGDYFGIEGNFEKVKEQPNLLENPFYYCPECRVIFLVFRRSEAKTVLVLYVDGVARPIHAFVVVMNSILMDIFHES